MVRVVIVKVEDIAVGVNVVDAIVVVIVVVGVVVVGIVIDMVVSVNVVWNDIWITITTSGIYTGLCGDALHPR